jgi:hypothetical protein
VNLAYPAAQAATVGELSTAGRTGMPEQIQRYAQDDEAEPHLLVMT